MLKYHKIWSQYLTQQEIFFAIEHAFSAKYQRKSQDKGFMHLLHGCFIDAWHFCTTVIIMSRH